MTLSRQFTLQFLYKKEIGKDTFSFYFSRPEEFAFLAGQYNRWTLPIMAADGKGSSRFFTISSSPFAGNFLTLTAKVGTSDFKKALLQIREGDTISIFGPMGQLVLDETDTREKVFLAGGMGITPFYSMLIYASQKNLNLPFTLIAAFSFPEEAVFFEQLTGIVKAHPNIGFFYTRGISQGLIKKYVKNIPNSVFYIAGPPPMVKGVRKTLEELRIPEEDIRVEEFSGY